MKYFINECIEKNRGVPQATRVKTKIFSFLMNTKKSNQENMAKMRNRKRNCPSSIKAAGNSKDS